MHDIGTWLSGYVEPVFLFCMKRLSNRQDSEDLAQEILTHTWQALRKGQVEQPQAYLWRIAHNRYARLMQKRSRQPMPVQGDDVFLEPAAQEDITLPPEDNPAQDTIYRALHTLSALHRDIMVDYYVHRRSLAQIAERFDIPETTVKGRLFTGRIVLRERMDEIMEQRMYEPKRLHVTGNITNVNPDTYLGRFSQQAIAQAAYDKPLSDQEISIASGIPTMYLQDDLRIMERGEILSREGKKYLTNILIVPAADIHALENIMVPALEPVTDCIQAALPNLVRDMQATNPTCATVSGNQWAFWVVPIMMKIYRRTQMTAMQKIILTPRLDGGFGMLEAFETIDKPHGVFMAWGLSCNDGTLLSWFHLDAGDVAHAEYRYFLDANAMRIPWRDLAKKGVFQEGDVDEYLLANGLRWQFIEAVPQGYLLTIPVFTKAERQVMQEAINAAATPLLPLLRTASDVMTAHMRTVTPKRFQFRIDMFVSDYMDNSIATVLDMLVQRGALEMPSGDALALGTALQLD